MAIIITDECINCGACEPECPNTAIYEGGVEWTWAGGTALTEVELGEHQKNVFFWAWGSTIVMTIVALLTGSIHI